MKRTRMGLTIGALGLGLLLTACGAGQEAAPAPAAAPVATPVATPVAATAPAVAPTPPPVEVPTEVPTPEPVADQPTPAAKSVAAVPPEWATTVTVEGDYYVLGNPAASVRVLDYSDFL